MFKIIGADGRQYGPIPTEQLRQWIAEGRANAQTMVQPEGAADWKPLSAFPEFADALAAKAPPPSAGPPPLVSGPDPKALADEILARDYTLIIGNCFSRAWDKLKSDFWPIVGVSALVGILLGVSNSIYVGILLNGPFLGGLYWYYLKHMRGQRPEISDVFAGFTLAFLQLMLAGLVVGILTSIGLALCVIPGIYLGVAWCLTVPLVMDKKLQFWDAMEVSRKVLSKHWWTVFLLLLLSVLLNIAGVICCFVGVFVTGPLTGLALMYAYEDIFGAARSQQT